MDPSHSRENQTDLYTAFRAQVARTPEATALSGRHGATTYRELAARADGLARRLGAAGVQPGDVVGVLLPRSEEAVVAILAIVQLGGLYMPLDLAMPDERIAFMLGDAAARLVVTRYTLASRLGHAQPLLDLDGEAPSGVTAATPTPTEPEVAAPDGRPCGQTALAAIFYTSGSTGRPKGLSIPQAGILNLVFDQSYCPFGPAQVHLLLSSLAFDFSTLELWGALLTGARLALYEDTFVSLDELGRVIRAQGVTTLMLTPNLFTLLVSERLDDLRGLRQVLLGGDVPSVKAVRAFLQAAPGAAVTNVYGPTENTVFTTCYTVRDPNFADHSLPIGRPIPGTQALLLDEAGQEVAPGEVGELWLGGVGLTPGYLRRPELNAHKFASHPLATTPGGRLYRSGDLARQSGGDFEFIGRLDHQVKIRGHRVEPGEIEAVLREHPQVREAAVVAVPGRMEGEDKRLVAYIQPAPGERGLTEPLRAHLAGRLPRYMVPAALIELETLPLTSSGKIDRQGLTARELPAAPAPFPAMSSGTAPPSTPAALDELTAVWQEVLGGPVGPDDDFFALGGTSLQAALLLTRLSQRLGREIHPNLFFAGPTVRGLSARLAQDAESCPPGVIRLRAGPAGRALFFSGDPYLYRRLQPHLHTEGAVYVLHGPLARVEEMAAHAIVDLRAMQPHGPYRLAGFSFEGLVAYEMACQLARAGEETEYLALLDTATPQTEEALALSMRHFWPRLLAHLRFAGKLPLRRRVLYLWQRARLSARVRLNRQERNPVFDTLLQLARTYTPGPYAGTVTLFRADHEDTNLVDPLMGWHKVAARVEVHNLPGLHLDLMLEPQSARQLAAQLNADLGVPPTVGA